MLLQHVWSAVISIFCLSAVIFFYVSVNLSCFWFAGSLIYVTLLSRFLSNLLLLSLSSVPFFSISVRSLLWTSTLQVPMLKEQKQRFRGVQHIHRETPVHREGPSLRPASTKLYLVSAAGSGWVSCISCINAQKPRYRHMYFCCTSLQTPSAVCSEHYLTSYCSINLIWLAFFEILYSD